MAYLCSSPRTVPPLVHYSPSPLKAMAVAIFLSLLYHQFSRIYWTISSPYIRTVNSSILNKRPASVHRLQVLCFYSPMSPPNQVLSPYLYQNCPSHKWPHIAKSNDHFSVLWSRIWHVGLFLSETLSSLAHKILTHLFVLFFKALFLILFAGFSASSQLPSVEVPCCSILRPLLFLLSLSGWSHLMSRGFKHNLYAENAPVYIYSLDLAPKLQICTSNCLPDISTENMC